MTASPCIWHRPPANLMLFRDEVHVWCACLDQPIGQVQQLAQTLSADEITRAERFHFQQHRNHFIVSRGTLRAILGRYLDIEPSELQFCYKPRGKPVLAQTFGSGALRFNVSHSQDLALYAVTRDHEIGIDLEYLRLLPDAEQIAKRFFSVREYAVIHALPPSQKPVAFFKGWTRKEAYVKAIGDGLAYPLDQIEVTLAPGEPVQLLSIAGSVEAASHWSLMELIPERDYIAALAVEGNCWEITCWHWSE